MTRRIAWLNEKGGSGKSTSALNVSSNLASRFGKRVLLVDVDHQANITAVLTRGLPGKHTLTQVLLENLPVSQAIAATHHENLDLLPADAALADVNVAMAEEGSSLGMGREFRLKRALEKIEQNYDYVIIDTGPQRTLLNINVLVYVDEVFVPIDPGFWSIMGIEHLDGLIKQVRENMNHKELRIGGILLTKVQRTNMANDVEDHVRQQFGTRVFKTSIPLNVKIEEAHSRGISVLDYDPECSGAKAYLALTEEIVAHGRE